jgi:hypothetical protein
MEVTMTKQSAASPSLSAAAEAPSQGFVFDVDGTTYTHDRPQITGAEIMALAGIDPAEGLVQCFEDGSQQTVAPDDIIRLVPKPRFRKRPRFKRG